MNKKILELLSQISAIGSQQLVALERKHLEEMCELDKQRQKLIGKIREIEQDRASEFHKDRLKTALLASDEDRGQIKRLIDKIVSTDRELTKKIECQMSELAETIEKITKLRSVFCPVALHKCSGKKLNVSA